jgi:uncharacterized membrane protein YqiK
MMAMKVQQIKQSGGVGTPQDVVGLSNAASYVGKHIQLLTQDESEKQRVKQYGDILGKIGNSVKAMAERQAEAAKNQNGQIDAETQAKIQGQMALTQQKLQAKQAADALKLQTKQAQFEQKQQHERVKLAGEMYERGVQTTVEAGAEHARSAAEVKAIHKKSDAEAEAVRKKAAATPKKASAD